MIEKTPAQPGNASGPCETLRLRRDSELRGPTENVRRGPAEIKRRIDKRLSARCVARAQRQTSKTCKRGRLNWIARQHFAPRLRGADRVSAFRKQLPTLRSKHGEVAVETKPSVDGRERSSKVTLRPKSLSQ
jgi:hypothetical protein